MDNVASSVAVGSENKLFLPGPAGGSPRKKKEQRELEQKNRNPQSWENSDVSLLLGKLFVPVPSFVWPKLSSPGTRILGRAR